MGDTNLSHQLRSEEFRQIIEHSVDAIIILNMKEIIFINQAGLKLIGIPKAQDILGRSIDPFLYSDFHEIFNERLRKVISEREIAEFMEHRMITLNGDTIDVEVIIFPFSSQNRSVAQMIIRDTTVRKKYEARLREAKKLSYIGQISTGIAHEIKNPLTAVKGFLQMLKEEVDHQYIEIALDELDNALNTLHNLLQVSKPDSSDEAYVLFNLCSEIESIINLFQDQFYRVQIVTEFQDEDKMICGKKNLIKKAFFNLIKNAFEAIPDEGTITLYHYTKSGCIHVKITDTGIGIPKDKIRTLGTPFYSTKPEGTGIGLTHVFTTFHEHGASIEIDSYEGKGTTFLIKFPMAEPV
jgi:two-component system sporulation sensor kinase A